MEVPILNAGARDPARGLKVAMTPSALIGVINLSYLAPCELITRLYDCDLVTASREVAQGVRNWLKGDSARLSAVRGAVDERFLRRPSRPLTLINLQLIY